MKNIRKTFSLPVIAGLVFLLLAAPLFIFFNLFPTVSSQVGPHQLSSWISILMGFIGFMLLIYGLGEQDL